jgi:hypothetical protein
MGFFLLLAPYIVTVQFVLACIGFAFFQHDDAILGKWILQISQYLPNVICSLSSSIVLGCNISCHTSMDGEEH